jgi:hypothetical protein
MSEMGEIIKEARRLIASGRWTQGRSSKFDNCGRESFCVVGAICRAGKYSKVTTNATADFVEKFAPWTAEDNHPISLRPLARFNDLPSTKAEDVVSVFDKALAELGEL